MLKKRICAGALTVSMLAVTLSGCGNVQEQEATEAQETSTVSAGDLSYPIVEEPVTLRVLAGKGNLTEEFDTLKIFQELEELTNVKIEWEYTTSDWDTQKPLLLANGNLPDIFLGGILSDDDVNANADLFLAMNSYLDSYCPNVSTMFEEQPALKGLATLTDGNIYGLPSMWPNTPTTYSTIMINKTWLDNLGLPVPETTEEFYETLKAFRESDPNGNGKQDEIPLTFIGFDDLAGCLELLCPFGVVDSLGGNWLSVTDGQVEYIAVLERFKEAVSWLNQLYSEGLIDQEAFTQDWPEYSAKLMPEGDQIVGAAISWTISGAVGTENADDYIVLPPLKGPYGDQYARQNPEMLGADRNKIVVSADTEYPEVAMRWVDALYDKVTSMQIRYGALGVTIEQNEDGSYEVQPAPEGMDSNTWSWKYGLNTCAPGYAVGLDIIPQPDAQEKLAADEISKAYVKDEYYPLLTIPAEYLDELAILKTDISSYASEQTAQWIVNGGVEEEWDSYLERMNVMGLERMLEIYQTTYDAYRES
ncbi:MAG: extracellular solute-binding protein [Eubacteriales bacterium]|nr:extracellular solute-binding protein [Eubacteriales bacterium]